LLLNATDDPREMARCERLGFARSGLAQDQTRSLFRWSIDRID
jgi:hypothetical protein